MSSHRLPPHYHQYYASGHQYYYYYYYDDDDDDNEEDPATDCVTQILQAALAIMGSIIIMVLAGICLEVNRGFWGFS